MKSLYNGIEGKRDSFRQFRLAATGRALNQNRFLQFARDVNLGERDFITMYLACWNFRRSSSIDKNTLTCILSEDFTG